MRKLTVKKAEDCPFSVFYDTMWCTYPRDNDFDQDPFCVLYSRPSPPCPLVGGLQLELEDEDMVNWGRERESDDST